MPPKEETRKTKEYYLGSTGLLSPWLTVILGRDTFQGVFYMHTVMKYHMGFCKPGPVHTF